MESKRLKEALHAGDRVYGTLIVSPSPHWPQVVKSTGVDFVFLDTEHIPLDRAQLSWMCQTYRAMSLSPIVRIPSPDPFAASMVMDGGACGVVAPYVESAQQVRELVGAVKLRPLKGRLLHERLDEGKKFPGKTEEYIGHRNADSLVFLNIESVPALEALDEILAVPGLDAVQVGPHDLSCSLGVPEDYGHPIFLEAIELIIRKSRAAGVGVGVHFWEELEQEIKWLRMGANLIMHSADSMLFAKTLRAELKQIRQALGDQPADDMSKDIAI